MSNSKKISVSLITLLVVAYVAGAVYFNKNSYPNTKVNGQEKKTMPIESLFDNNVDDEGVDVNGRDGKNLHFKMKDIDLKMILDEVPKVDQKVYAWPFQLLRKHDYEADYKVEYSQDKLDELVNKSDIMKDQVEPKDAFIEYDKENNSYHIVEDIKGDTIEASKVKDAIVSSLNNGDGEVNLEDLYENPKILADDSQLIDQLEKIKALTSKKLVFDFEDREYVLTGEDIFNVYDEVDGQFQLNRDKLREFVADVAAKTDTYATRRSFEATGIGTIEVEPGIYGWRMDVDTTTDNVKKMLEEGNEGKVDIVYDSDDYFNYTAVSRKKDDIGNTYIEVDLSRQTMWFYKNGELIVETPIVSGNGKLRRAATPTGVNKVRVKESPKMLRGNNEVTGEAYEVPVKYWINVGWTGSGIHDTFYRHQYGGSVYLTDGSSSCINTPIDAVEKIYKNVEYGTPVVIYESSTDYSPNEFEKQAINSARGQ